MSDYSELKKLAAAAPVGPWNVAIHDDCEYVEGAEGEFIAAFDTPEGAEFMAAANPAAVMALIEELETYQMSISHQMVRSTIKTFTGEAASGVAAACKASTESGLIATLECAQGDLRQAMQIIEKQQDLLRRTLNYYTESCFPEDLLVEVKAAIGDAS